MMIGLSSPRFGALGMAHLGARWAKPQAPDDGGVNAVPASTGLHQAPQSPAAPIAPKAPDFSSVIARSQARRAERASRLAQPPKPGLELPDDIKKKVEFADRIEKELKSSIEQQASSLSPEQKAILDVIPDLQAKKAFLAMLSQSQPQSQSAPGQPGQAQQAARQPVGAAAAPPSQAVDIDAIVASKGIDYAKKNYPREYAELERAYQPGSRSTSISRQFNKKK